MFRQNMMEGELHNIDMTQKPSDSEIIARLSRGDEEFDIEGNACGDENQDQPQRGGKRKRYHRHTQRQIEEMEKLFKECPHPDDKQRKELGRQLGLDPMQIKFWFQNKRTQMKNQHDRHENTQLRDQNEMLKCGNLKYREALSKASCPNCGGPTAIGEMSFDEHHLRLENGRLREEIDRISGIAAKYVGKPVADSPIMSSPMARGPPELGGASNLIDRQTGHGGPGSLHGFLIPEADKQMIIELATAAMEEFISMAQMGEPLWVTKGNNNVDGGGTLELNEEEYLRTFPRGIGPRPTTYRREASRVSGVVVMNHLNLVEYLMDVNRWCSLFSGIVSKAVILDVLSTGADGNYNGALQVMTAEFQLPTPVVPARETYYARYCKQHDGGTWAVVDVSLDNLRPSTIDRCRRRPSGCLIQEMPNGYSKVTWVEHVEVDHEGIHNLYKQVVSSGNAFGARRWVATLNRQCERLASFMATDIPTTYFGATINQEGKKSLMKLAERLVLGFCSGVSGSVGHAWTALSGTGANDVRVATRKTVDDPGCPSGIVLSAATSFWIPAPPNTVFDFFRDGNSRTEWDMLSNCGVMQEMVHITNGREMGNCVSLLCAKSPNSSQGNSLVLQETFTDPTASFIIYAPVEAAAMNTVLNGGDPDYVALLPSGFAILPDGADPSTRKSAGGSLLTVVFQILVESASKTKLTLGSVAMVNNLITCTVEKIKNKFLCESA